MLTKTDKIKILIVDDSAVYRTLINRGLAMKDGIEVVGTAYDADDAMEKIKRLKPDVLSLDVEMPKMTGIELTKQLMATAPMPIILVSSANISVFDALHAGAVDFVKKPEGNTPPEKFIDELYNKIKIASVARIRKPVSASSAAASVSPSSTSSTVSAASAAAAKAVSAVSSTLGTTPKTPAQTPSGQSAAASVSSILGGPKECPERVCESTLIALGASTGGTESTLEVLKRLPAKMPPILIVQHMPPGFTKLYAERLNKNCALNVKEAEDGDVVKSGWVYIAPGDRQMRLVNVAGVYKIKCQGTDLVSGHCPSVDVLFHSYADVSQKNNVGIILTGMGKDGAEGMLAMKNKGAYTIGENQESCVVYGMPMVAFNIGGVTVQAANKDIPAILLKHLNTL